MREIVVVVEKVLGFKVTSCVFYHTPKTGGTSIRFWFDRYIESKNTSSIKIEKVILLDKSSCIKVIDNSSTDQNFSFTVIRNPWDRVVSLYGGYLRANSLINQGKTEKFFSKDLEWLSKKFTFEEFVLDVWTNDDSSKFREYFKWKLPQDQVTPAVDYILRFESLVTDFEKIQNRLDSVIPLSKENIGKFRNVDYRSYYSYTTKNIISTYYQEFADKFEYFF